MGVCLLDTVFSLLPHMVKGGRDLSWVSFVRALNPSIRAPPSEPGHLSKTPPPPNRIALTFRISTYKFCCFCSVTHLCLNLCDPMDCSVPGLPVLHHLAEFAQVLVHCINDAIQPFHQVRQIRWSGIPISLTAFHSLL